MKKHEFALLLFLFFLSATIYIFPLTNYLIWGSDTGEYYTLTKRLAESGFASTDYEGWGFGYPYFQGMFIIGASFNVVMNISIFDALRFIIPIISASGSVFLFLIARKVFHSNASAFFASLFLSLSMPHAFPTSHPMPGALGDLLLIFLFLTFIKTRENKKFYWLLALGIPAIAITHHLSAFLLFLALICSSLLMHQYCKAQHTYLLPDFLLLLYAYLVFITFWIFLGGSFNEMIVKVGMLGLEPKIVSVALLAFFPLLYFIMKKPFLRKIFAYKGKFLDVKTTSIRFLACISVILAIFIPLIFIQIPGTSISLKPEILLTFLPLMLIYSFTTVGSKLADLFRHGIAIFALLLGISISLLAGVLIAPEVLIPYRHIEYLLIPLAIFAGAGAFYIYKMLGNKKIFLVAIALICLLALPSIYPQKSIMVGFQEGTSAKEFESVLWAGLDRGAYASDHRMSSMLFGFSGCYATWDTTPETFFGSDVGKTLEELRYAKAPHKERAIAYVLISADMREGCAMSPLEPARKIPQDVEEKFTQPPFIKVYDNGEVQIYKTGL